MCLIALAWRQHPDYPLVVAANRDEFFSRPTALAGWWPDQSVLAGRDERAGGTWLGVTPAGRFAALTNFRQLPVPDSGGASQPSRGRLVSDYLVAGEPGAFHDRIAATGENYAGFNMLCASGVDEHDELHYFSNRGPARHSLSPGVYGLSNALLDDPWPKLNYARGALGNALAEDDFDSAMLLALLDNRERAADDKLPDTGVGIEAERLLSSAFIVSPGYGTRCSTVFIAARDGSFSFHERTFDPDGRPSADVEFHWQRGTDPVQTVPQAGAQS